MASSQARKELMKNKPPVTWSDVMRKRLMWLEGFCAGIQSPELALWIETFRKDLNNIDATVANIPAGNTNAQVWDIENQE